LSVIQLADRLVDTFSKFRAYIMSPIDNMGYRCYRDPCIFGNIMYCGFHHFGILKKGIK